MNDDDLIRVVDIAGVIVLSALVVGLYVLKRRKNWQGWRRAGPYVFSRTLGRVWWFVAKKVPWKPILVWGPWVLMILGVGFYLVENWRGKKAPVLEANCAARSMQPRMSASGGAGSTRPPNASIIRRRSRLAEAGMTATNRRPNWAHAMAMAIEVDPLEASTTVSPGFRVPSRTALSRI